MSVLLDSDVLIEVLRGRQMGIIDRWRQLATSSDPMLCTPVPVCELWHGALFAALICPPIDAEIGRRAGEYMNQYSKSHTVEIADALIAATALHHDAALWTLDRKHYPMKDVAFY